METSHLAIGRQDHELVLTVPSGAAYVDGDLTRLAKVVANLQNNAAKYADPGGRTGLVADVRGRHA